MLGKLLKYDLKKIYKFLGIFYSLAIFFAILTRIFFNISGSFILSIVAKILSGITISMIVNILINNMMRLWVRFKGTLYDDESYLTHTLPISKKTLYTSKIIVSVITVLTSTIIIGITLFIAYYSKDTMKILKSVLLPFANLYNSSVLELIFLLLLTFFTEFLCLVQVGYTGIILGHFMPNGKVGFSVLYGFISYIIVQLIVLFCAFLTSFFNKDIMNLFITNEVVNISVLKSLGILCIGIYIVIFFLNFFVNIKIFKRGVNVE